MKNKIGLRTLSRTSAHRLAMFRTMVTQLIHHERIKTTLPKAKELRRIADRMITWAKIGTEPFRVKANGFVRDKETVQKLWSELAPRYRVREGGYCRVVRCGFRTGDRAPMAIIEYVDREGEVRPARPARPAAHPRHLQPNPPGRSAAAAAADAAAAAGGASKEAAAAPLR